MYIHTNIRVMSCRRFIRWGFSSDWPTVVSRRCVTSYACPGLQECVVSRPQYYPAALTYQTDIRANIPCTTPVPNKPFRYLKWLSERISLYETFRKNYLWLQSLWHDTLILIMLYSSNLNLNTRILTGIGKRKYLCIKMFNYY